ncbi:hypothetical protein BV25DRAFT_1829436 [Artomyces pyxidatus]|uniref:Uncharacterized protein n=1 Tax=Artomyces pyxidatus TaxID=48021 RepID=A0ACB8SR94_9AGAM|nr:hypothetical protein BV25DRAFT_1829436 [Artomyces pyxidatus]
MTPDSYLVIGGGGFLGRHIVDLLLARGELAVAVFDIAHVDLGPTVKVFTGDIVDENALGNAIRVCGATCIIHTAAALPGRPRQDHEKINIQGTENVINTALANGVKKLVYTSSASVVFEGKDQAGVNESAPYPARPLDDYNDTKAIAETAVLRANGTDGLETVSLRIAGIFGPRDRLTVPGFMALMTQGRTHIQLGDNTNLFDWTYIVNAAEAHLLAADRLAPEHPKHAQVAGRVFFISNGEPRPWWNLARGLWKEAGHVQTRKVIAIPRSVAFVLAVFMEFFGWLFGKAPSLTRFRVTVCTTIRWCDISNARNALDYGPSIPLDEGIRQTVEWWKTTQSHPK